MSPSTSIHDRSIVVGPFDTRYLEAGDPAAPPVVLVHDGTWGGSSSASWTNCIPALAERYRVLAPDMLGFGGTAKAVFVDRAQYEARTVHLQQWMELLGVDGPVHLVGTSFGGSLALRAAVQDPGFAIASVTSICGTGGPWRSATSLAELDHWDGTREDLRRIVELLVERPECLEPQLDERYRWAADAGHYRAIKAAKTPLPPALARIRGAERWPAQLAEARAPVMVVGGRRDELLEPGWTDRIRAAAPAVRAELLDCTHAPNIDRPDLLVPVLLDFFFQAEKHVR